MSKPPFEFCVELPNVLFSKTVYCHCCSFFTSKCFSNHGMLVNINLDLLHSDLNTPEEACKDLDLGALLTDV